METTYRDKIEESGRQCVVASLGEDLHPAVEEHRFMVISILMILASTVSLLFNDPVKRPYNTHPISAINFVFGTVAISLSIYQIVISMLLMWQALVMKPNIFLCSVWYVSHLTILFLYGLLFSGKALICICEKEYLISIVTTILGVVYEGTFIYFSIVVNSYLHSLYQDRYL